MGPGERALLLPEGIVLACQPSGTCGRDDGPLGVDEPDHAGFPYHFVDTPDGVAVGVSFACAAVRAHQGAPLLARRSDVLAALARSAPVEPLPEPLTLYGGIDVSWSTYRAIETALLALLAPGRAPLPVALVAGSALLSLAVGLTQIEARARRVGRSPAATLAGALDELAATGYRGLLDVAASARYPRRPSLIHLAPPFTWLELAPRPPSRASLLLRLARNVLRFRHAHGWLPDVITAGDPVALQALQRITFDPAAAGVALCANDDESVPCKASQRSR